MSYQTEKELKSESPKEKGYTDLLIHYENKDMIIELERTRKTIKRFEDKLDSLRQYLKQNIHIMWLVPNENMKKFVNERIKSYNWKLEQQHIEIFNS